MYGCESWTVKKAEHWKIDAFELWCWRRLLRVPWTARRSNQSFLKEISPGCSLEGLMLKQRVGHNWATELNWTLKYYATYKIYTTYYYYNTEYIYIIYMLHRIHIKILLYIIYMYNRYYILYYVHIYVYIIHTHTSVQFTHSVVSNSFWPHGLQHTRIPCLSPTPTACSNSRPSSRWCHPTISSSVIPFSSCLQSFPASGSFQISQLFTSGGQSIGVSASAWVLPMNIQDWFPLGWTGWISLQSKGLSRIFFNTTVLKHQFLGAQLSL